MSAGRVYIYYLIGILGGGFQLGPLATAATNRLILPVPGDYDNGEIGGMMIGKVNPSTRKKSAPLPLCPPQIRHAARTRTRVAAGGHPATNRLSYGTAQQAE
jgi:hypothetical protein